MGNINLMAISRSSLKTLFCHDAYEELDNISPAGELQPLHIVMTICHCFLSILQYAPVIYRA